MTQFCDLADVYDQLTDNVPYAATPPRSSVCCGATGRPAHRAGAGLRHGAAVLSALALCPALGATDAAPAMIQEAKKRIALTPPLLCPGCRPSATRRSPSTRWSSPMPAHPAGAGSRAPGDPAGSEAGRMVVCPYLCPRRRAAGKASHLVYGANRFPCLPPLERRRVCLLSVHARFLGGGARAAGRPCAAPLLRRLPVDTGGTDLRTECRHNFRGCTLKAQKSKNEHLKFSY